MGVDRDTGLSVLNLGISWGSRRCYHILNNTVSPTGPIDLDSDEPWTGRWLGVCSRPLRVWKHHKQQGDLLGLWWSIALLFNPTHKTNGLEKGHGCVYLWKNKGNGWTMVVGDILSLWSYSHSIYIKKILSERKVKQIILHAPLFNWRLSFKMKISKYKSVAYFSVPSLAASSADRSSMCSVLTGR